MGLLWLKLCLLPELRFRYNPNVQPEGDSNDVISP
jgi:hypothetical protein